MNYAGIAPSYSFLVYAAAVGAYFKGGQLAPIDLIVEERFHRAAPGGTGGTKAAGNYTPVRGEAVTPPAGLRCCVVGQLGRRGCGLSTGLAPWLAPWRPQRKFGIHASSQMFA